jgi:predicted Zn-dependent peptidase
MKIKLLRVNQKDLRKFGILSNSASHASVLRKLLVFLKLSLVGLSLVAQSAPTTLSNEVGKLSSFRLENGLRVLIIQPKETTELAIRLVVDRPLVLEKTHVGTATLTEQMLLTGTKTRSQQQIASELTQLDAELSSEDRTISITAPSSEHLAELLGLTADLVRNPSFSPTGFERLQAEAIAQEKSLETNTSHIAEELARQVIYGTNHPYGERRQIATLEHIDLRTIRNFHQRYYRPAIAYLAIVSNADTTVIREQVERYFGDWKSVGPLFAEFFNPAAIPERTQYNFVNAPLAELTSVNIGYSFRLLPGSKDALAVHLLNETLRNKLKSQAWFPEDGIVELLPDPHLARLKITMDLPAEKVPTALREITATMHELRDSTSTVYNKLRPIKIQYRQQLKEGYGKPTVLAQEGIKHLWFRIPMDDFAKNDRLIPVYNKDEVGPLALDTAMYMFPTLHNARLVTTNDIQEAALNYLIPSRMQVIVVGNRSLISVLQQLAQPGEVHFYTPQGNKMEASLPTIGTLEREPAEVINSYLKARGGRRQLTQVKDLYLEYASTLQGQPFVKTEAHTTDGKWLQLSKVGEVLLDKIVVNDSVASSYRGLTEEALTEQRKAVLHESAILFPELRYAELGYRLAIKGTTIINGAIVDEIEITSPAGNVQTDYFAQKTGLRVRSVSRLGEQLIVRDLLDYRSHSGILFPQQIIYSGITEEPLSFQLKLVEINQGLEKVSFE